MLTSIHSKYDLLSKYGLHIVGEYAAGRTAFFKQQEAAPDDLGPQQHGEKAVNTGSYKWPLLHGRAGPPAVAKTVVIHGQTKQMKAEGKQVWSLCVGEPDNDPHEHMQATGAKAMSEGNTKYAHMKGMMELRGLI
ncbi:hypothetical protein PR003_g23307 [Phytophthora rubi]|uniref:Uncharacterized protein n=1 Tax=Phytophthora rubi TaxID=129364 RepID=A0A6A3IP79_9STRA|nr:hypothetical protein PR002_g23559 [Phytophthora rubi]KAE8983325.1 hypothetical protein PR001_g23476 [Phytophthora rubi]KAE9298175.1 hypothetical protein PR003_g23307 [Phytophthora rubi]